MQQNLINVLERTDISYFIGNESCLSNMTLVHSLEPFCDDVIEFLSLISNSLLSDKEAKGYPDVVTFAFWIRKASIVKMKQRFTDNSDNIIRLGRGVVFHIAPSNVPVNYAYSLVTGILTGNSNIVRISSKDFPQVAIINRAISQALDAMPSMKPYICIIRYGHNQEVSKELSLKVDTRVIWGGDNTIKEIRNFPMKARGTEITFADRYSLCVIDSETYIEKDNKERIANDIYNDTFLTDQNACTSPSFVVWVGSKIKEAKEIFWCELHKVVKAKYTFQDIQGVNKLTSAYLMAASKDGVTIEKSIDNLIVRVLVNSLDKDLINFRNNSGYFIEYDCKEMMVLADFCDDDRCQTLSYIGNLKTLKALLKTGCKGIDRIVPVGKTMDYDIIWDGYNLFERMTRLVYVM